MHKCFQVARLSVFAFVCVSSCSELAFAQPQTTVSEPNLSEARERNQRGLRLVDARNWAAALAEFERVYALLEGHPRRPLALSNIARCYQEMGQYQRAIEYYERFLAESPADSPDRSAATQAVEVLRDLVATVDITTNVGTAEVWVDGQLVGNAPGSVRVPGGRHTFQIRNSQFSPVQTELQLAAGDRWRWNARLERTGGIPPAVFITGTVLTGVTAIVGFSLGIAAMQQRAALVNLVNDQNNPQRFSVSAQDFENIRPMTNVADVFFGLSAAFAVSSTIVVFLTNWGTPGRSELRRAGQTVISPSLGSIQLYHTF